MPGASKCQPAYYCQLFRICSIFLHFLGEKNVRGANRCQRGSASTDICRPRGLRDRKDQALPCRALFCPSQYKNAPTATNAPVPPTTFAIASAGWASPGLGTNERAMVRDAVLNPTQESNNAVGLPPGTRITSGPAGSLCKRNIAPNKNR